MKYKPQPRGGEPVYATRLMWSWKLLFQPRWYVSRYPHNFGVEYNRKDTEDSLVGRGRFFWVALLDYRRRMRKAYADFNDEMKEPISPTISTFDRRLRGAGLDKARLLEILIKARMPKRISIDIVPEPWWGGVKIRWESVDSWLVEVEYNNGALSRVTKLFAPAGEVFSFGPSDGGCGS